MGFLYQLQRVLPNVKLLSLLSVRNCLQRGSFLQTTEELSIYCSRVRSMSPIVIHHPSFKNNIVIHSLIQMCGGLSCLYVPWGLRQYWQAAILDWLQTDKRKEGMETPGSAKRHGSTAFQRPGVWENPVRIPGNKIYSRNSQEQLISLFWHLVSFKSQ